MNLVPNYLMESREVYFKEYVGHFSVDYNATDKSDIKHLQVYNA